MRCSTLQRIAQRFELRFQRNNALFNKYEVVSPGLRVHTYTYVCGPLFKNEEYSHTFLACSQSSGEMTSFSRRINSQSGWNDSGRTGHRAKRPASFINFKALYKMHSVHLVLLPSNFQFVSFFSKVTNFLLQFLRKTARLNESVLCRLIPSCHANYLNG